MASPRDLLISDLDKNEWISLSMLYTKPEIPVCRNDIPTQENVDQWPNLHEIFLPYVHSVVGLLIASDFPHLIHLRLRKTEVHTLQEHVLAGQSTDP